ncbi:hypothetical protein ACIU1J_11850 [Azospirillum doebereinerae]|uniref:hypothetical protein n=1 Tax=Azospirillum doebereinerae TaxID=92933 RepID=UPI001EE5EF2C|nr:hypothetical protein [Azospirillum doebereinerae]MCG5242807.1 hypothetical protein [Azospirillum doebereinerae]
MAIDATSIDSGATQRAAAPRERTSPVISDGHNGGPVEIRGEMSFWDFLDVINPLQHIPIVSTIYRNVTGDTIQPAARVMGGMLYGGPLGGMAAITNAVVEEAQGKDIPDQIMTALGFEGGDHPTGSVAVADASGGSAGAGSPVDPLAAKAAFQAAEGPAGSPVKLGAATSGSAAVATGTGAAGAAASPSLAAQLAAGAGHGGGFTGGKMPARDTPLASSTMVKHSVPKFAAPLPGSIPVNAQAAKPGAAQAGAQPTAQAANANATPAANANGTTAPEPLSETMMRNLAKYEQSRKAAQSAAPALRVSS